MEHFGVPERTDLAKWFFKRRISRLRHCAHTLLRIFGVSVVASPVIALIWAPFTAYATTGITFSCLMLFAALMAAVRYTEYIQIRLLRDDMMSDGEYIQCLAAYLEVRIQEKYIEAVTPISADIDRLGKLEFSLRNELCEARKIRTSPLPKIAQDIINQITKQIQGIALTAKPLEEKRVAIATARDNALIACKALRMLAHEINATKILVRDGLGTDSVNTSEPAAEEITAITENIQALINSTLALDKSAISLPEATSEEQKIPEIPELPPDEP